MTNRLIVILVLSFAAATVQPAHADCFSLFRRIGAFFKSESTLLKEAELRDYLAANPALAGRYPQAVLKSAFERGMESLNPYTIGYDLVKVPAKEGQLSVELFTALAELEMIRTLPSHDLRILSSRASAWVTSDAHALYLYSVLGKFDPAAAGEIFETLLSTNPFFTKVTRAKGVPRTLVTYSFEKEGATNTITMFFKNPKFTDEQWFELSDEQRLQQLKDLTKTKKKFLAADVIAPTQYKPSYMSGYSQELDDAMNPDFAWEISNKAYEINLDRLMNEIEEVTHEFKQTHSIHAHIVFYMPLKSTRFSEFTKWSKQVNDYLILRGLEEGLGPKRLTGVAQLPGETNYVARGGSSINYVLPSSVEKVEFQNYKFLSMGLRGDIYGKSPFAGFKKLGLELRDTTRDIKKLRAYMESISESASKTVWDTITAPQLITRLEVESTKSIQKLEAIGIQPEVAKLLSKTHQMAGTPLGDFEGGTFMNYRTGEPFRPDTTKVEAIRIAREMYIKEITELQADILDHQKKGLPVIEEDLDTAIGMCLSSWAKKAQLSELFKYY